MNGSQGAIHPVEAPPLQTEGAANAPLPRVRMKDIQGMPGTVGGLVLRVSQLLFAVVALAVMATTSDFPSVTAFWLVVLGCLRYRYLQLLDVLLLPGIDSSIQFQLPEACIGLLVTRYKLMRLASMKLNEFWDFHCQLYLVAAAGLQSMWSLVLSIVDAYALLVGRRLQNYRLVRFFAVGDGVTSTLTFAAACASAGITVLIGNDLGACSKNHCTEFETATAMAFLSWFTALPSFLLNFWSLASR
ncbi:hypothetical protein BUALT_Bualt02G0045500 [Buddleja alternifolia]|uniref:CASP-like protein n=1 Tax=Buddleja alternifolia TaxID=168488 RepID=A0AAV6Y8B6_9LAMI|nr:hypothetical protein BUALT_Bualt02G0045500 [Buddleja alternifolia]